MGWIEDLSSERVPLKEGRWDYWRWPGIEGWGDGLLEEKAALWELPGGWITAVLNHPLPP